MPNPTREPEGGKAWLLIRRSCEKAIVIEREAQTFGERDAKIDAIAAQTADEVAALYSRAGEDAGTRLCPKCNGQKHVNTPPWVAGDSPQYTTASNETYPCPVCEGVGYVVPPTRSSAPGDATAPACPKCDAKLHKVTYPGGYLNEDQWASVRAGDWYCDNKSADHGERVTLRGFYYFWNRELAVPSVPAPSVSEAARTILDQMEEDCRKANDYERVDAIREVRAALASPTAPEEGL